MVAAHGVRGPGVPYTGMEVKANPSAGTAVVAAGSQAGEGSMARAVTCPSLRPCACAHVVRSQTTSQGGWGMLRRCGGCPQGAGGGRASSCTWKHGLQEHGRQAQQPAATFSRGNGVMAKIPRGFTRSQPQEPACHLVPARAATWRWTRAGARSADECVERLDGRAGRARACQGGACQSR
jgi:hypothetical protein